MGVPTSEVGYTIATTRRETTKVHKNMWWNGRKKTTLSEIFPILRRTERNTIIELHRCSCKIPAILVKFYSNLNFLNRLSKITQISNFMKIRPVEAELFYADGQSGQT